MKRLAIPVAILALVFAAGCGDDDDDNPNGPSNLTVFTVNLLPSLEVPPVTNAEQSARGTAVITVHRDTNAIDFNINVNSFPAGSTLTNAHIHNAPAGVNAGAFIAAVPTGGFPAIVNGAATYTFTAQANADQVTQILANPAGFYFNLHTR